MNVKDISSMEIERIQVIFYECLVLGERIVTRKRNFTLCSTYESQQLLAWQEMHEHAVSGTQMLMAKHSFLTSGPINKGGVRPGIEKQARLLGACEVTDFRKESTTAILLDHLDFLLHPKTYLYIHRYM